MGLTVGVGKRARVVAGTRSGGARLTSKQTFHFISGLPRAGSTLTAAILRQNPRFHAGMSSPVAVLFDHLIAQVWFCASSSAKEGGLWWLVKRLV